MIYVFLGNGFEEIEALTPVDAIRRCELEVQTVGVGIIKGSHGISVICDIEQNKIVLDENLEMIILPGGMPGTLSLEASNAVQKAIDFCIENNIFIAAICAAPSILGHKGLLNEKTATCFPGFENQLLGACVSQESVCVDGNIITAKGAGVSLEFSFKLIELLTSKERAELLEESLQCK